MSIELHLTATRVAKLPPTEFDASHHKIEEGAAVPAVSVYLHWNEFKMKHLPRFPIKNQDLNYVQHGSWYFTGIYLFIGKEYEQVATLRDRLFRKEGHLGHYMVCVLIET